MRTKPNSRSETALSMQVRTPQPSLALAWLWTAPHPDGDLLQPSALSEAVSSKLQNSNVFTIAKRNVEAQDMLYQSLRLTNGIWVLAELRIQPGNPNFTVRTPLPPTQPGPTLAGSPA